MRFSTRFGCTAFLALLATQATAGMPFVEKMLCPVDGEAFEFTTTASYSTWGARADGKPYGSWYFPLALPECPGNGLVVYKEFAKAELPKLKASIETVDYRKLKGDTPRYRAAWLMRKMGEPAEEIAWTINVASWEADGDGARKSRYQAEFVDAVDALPPGTPADAINRFALQTRAANAERELGRFDAAQDRLARLGQETLPARPTGADTDYQEERDGWIKFARQLAKVVARRDSSPEPPEFVPDGELPPK